MGTQEVELPLAPTALLAACAQEPFAFALDGGGLASWGLGEALLGFAPRAVLQVAACGEATVRSHGSVERWSGEPLSLIERFHTHFQPTATIVTLSYELRHWVERLPAIATDDLRLPVLHAAAYDWMLTYSYADRRYRLRSGPHNEVDEQAILGKLRTAAASRRPTAPLPRLAIESNFSREAYIDAVRAVLAYIGAGDVYQVNLSQRFAAPANGLAAASLYAALQTHNPMPFAAFVDCGSFALVSSSPECFLLRRGSKVATFPIKGTRRRGSSEGEDAALIRALASDPKERAEHVMIVDLERNDLGKICRIGSIGVETFGQVTSFPTLHHMISKVAGELRAEVSLADILRATFPGGSITGAPKIRAMEIIDELEPVQRGFYTGSIGVLFADGDAVFNLAIRTATVTGDRVTYHAGGGLVADSIPEAEYAETLLKANSFLAAVGANFDA